MLRRREVTQALLGLLVACSDVQVDPDGIGGSSATGADAAGATGTETGTSTASTGAPVPVCEQLCDVTGNCLEDCEGMCAKLEQAQCAAEAQAYLGCLVEHYDAATCAAPTGCDCFNEARLFLECEGSAACGPEVCNASETGCACTRQCPYGEQKAVCHFGQDQVHYTCALNDSCGPNEIDFLDGFTCSLEAGVCGAWFGSTL